MTRAVDSLARLAVAGAAALAAALLASTGRADDVQPSVDPPTSEKEEATHTTTEPMSARGDVAPPSVDKPMTEDDQTKYAIDRTWLYGDDARVALPMTIVATSSFSYTNVGSDPTQVSSPYPKAAAGCYTSALVAQPCYSSFADNTAQPGGTAIVGGELGLLPHLSILGNVMVSGGGGNGVPSPGVGGTAALRVQVFPTSWTHAHLVVSGGYIREAWNSPVYDDDNDRWIAGQPGGANAAYFQLAMSGDIGRLRLAGTVHGQHTFSEGRDPLDVMVDLGATYRIAGGFRAGVEYVGQDLEESFDPEAEGGARHFLGPIASLQLWHDRLTIVGGPAIGLSSMSPDFVARVAGSVGF